MIDTKSFLCNHTPTRASPATRCPARQRIHLTFRLRMLAALASDLNITWISWRVSSPEGRGRVTSSATSFAASSNYKGQNRGYYGGVTVRHQGRSHKATASACQVAELFRPYQLQVLRRLFVQIVSEIFIKAGQVLHLHLHPVLTQVIMPFKLIPGRQ